MAPIRIAPSLACAPLQALGETVAAVENSGADYLHFDLEDGVFVPAMNLGTKVIADLRPLTEMPFDVHLMVTNPEWLLKDLVQMGADRISIHWEVCEYPRRTLAKIVSLGAQAGLALNPKTMLPDLSFLEPYLTFVVILTTEPEEVDPPFLPHVLGKVKEGRRRFQSLHLEWVVDGGINPANIADVALAGADTAVVGRSAFRHNKIKENLRALIQAAQAS